MVYLKLHDFQQDKPAAAARILDFLSLCPALQVFDFCGLPVDVRRSAKQTVHLPVLRVMHLRETCVGRDLLTHMHMPALEELHMSQLNVAFVGINGYQESGDSDDEAGDFSRSPYSDRLTGMMMRSLFRRCNPPLRVLDFDYVDMRTKDFLWCFAHMPHLEEFRIVASDMSDTVIDALGEPLDDEENWPLPRLRHLVLRDCNMIRGAVVGRMITARSVAGLLPAHYDVALCERVERRTVEIGLEDVVSMVGLTVYVEDVPPKEEPSMDAAVQEMHNMEE
ncbi:hypothetical protein BKA62DRAFT_624418 [Auriculariales sp. MPI-PUGE-AT-0066]|nr:hypothetical protein BKA62DRAFT_624418 [Auriculariales sp. MPI-PUGE-AT-0066]